MPGAGAVDDFVFQVLVLCPLKKNNIQSHSRIILDFAIEGLNTSLKIKAAEKFGNGAHSFPNLSSMQRQFWVLDPLNGFVRIPNMGQFLKESNQNCQDHQANSAHVISRLFM